MFYDVFLSLCEKANIKPSKAAEECGINRSNVSLWKSKGYTPRGYALQSLADYFGVSVDYLLSNEPKEKTPDVTVYDEHDNIIRLDNETLELIDSLRTRPEMKMMFSVSKNATKEDIIKAVKIIEALKDESEGK